MQKVILLVLMLSGCAITTPEPQQPPAVINHPEWPLFISEYKFDWQVVIKPDGDPVIGLSYDDSLDFRLLQEDLKRYIRQMNNLACFYRKELNEPICADRLDTPPK